MTTGAKSLTVALVLVLIVVPAVALASCSQDMAGMSDTQMVGMVMPPPGTSVSETPNASCCIFAPAEITSSWLPLFDSAATVVDFGATSPHYFPQHGEAVYASSFVTATPPTQATLCVFLI
jgi:hypothetical protein